MEVANGENSVRFSFWQDDKEIKPDAVGVIHLKTHPFAIHFSGDVENAALLTRTDTTIAQQLDQTTGQVISLVGMGAANDGKQLLIETEGELKSWDTFAAVFDEASRKGYEKSLQEELHEKPHVLEMGLQYLFCEDGAKTFSLPVNELYKVEWNKPLTLNISVFLTHKVCDNFCVTLKWVHIPVKLEN